MEEKTIESLKTTVMLEPLAEPTLKTGRQLLVASSLALLIIVYNAAVPSLAGGELPRTAEGRSVLAGALAVAIFYLLVKLGIYAWTDLRRWHLAGEAITMNNYAHAVRDAREHGNRATQLLSTWPQGKTPEAQEHARLMLSQAKDAVDRLDIAIKEFQSGHKVLGRLQGSRVLLDLGAPSALGMFTLWRAADYGWQFLARLL